MVQSAIELLQSRVNQLDGDRTLVRVNAVEPLIERLESIHLSWSFRPATVSRNSRLEILVQGIPNVVSHAKKHARGYDASPVPLFYVQNRGFCGNSLFWWKPDGNGYTCDLSQAWKVRGDERTWRPNEDILWPVEEADRLSERHVCTIPEEYRQ